MDYLNGVKRNISGVEITCDAHEGDAVTHIIEEADKSPESLVAMSSHGRSGITRLLMGSITDKVLHHTKNAMLIFREHRDGDPEPDTKLETIIVPLDGSPTAEQVLPHVAALALALNLKVTLPNVQRPGPEWPWVVIATRLSGVSNATSTMTLAAEPGIILWSTEAIPCLRSEFSCSVMYSDAWFPAA